jgi:hypothetical protein
MNILETLAARFQQQFSRDDSVEVILGKPVKKTGLWTLSFICADGFLLELAWQAYRGFALSAGYDLAFGEGFDEILGSEEAVFNRVLHLVETKSATDSGTPVGLADLRKIRGLPQHELATLIGVSKGRLAQIERVHPLEAVQIGTIERLIEAMGGTLVLTAKFPNGQTRELVV